MLLKRLVSVLLLTLACIAAAAAVLVPPFFLGPKRTAIIYFGLALFYGLIPKYKTIESKDGSRVLKSVLFDFRGIPLAFIPLVVAYLQNCTGIWLFVIWLVACYFGALALGLFYFCWYWSFRIVRVQDVKEGKTLWRFWLVAAGSESGFEAMWLEDHRTLLAAFSSEYDWLILLWDSDRKPQNLYSSGVTDVREYARIFGECPRFTWVRYGDDYAWLEDIWIRYEIDPTKGTEIRNHLREGEPYENQVRRFFGTVLGLEKALTFPNIWMWQLNSKKRGWILQACAAILKIVPEASAAYQELREEAVAKLRELEPLSEEELEIKNQGPRDYALFDPPIRKWMHNEDPLSVPAHD